MFSHRNLLEQVQLDSDKPIEQIDRCYIPFDVEKLTATHLLSPYIEGEEIYLLFNRNVNGVNNLTAFVAGKRFSLIGKFSAELFDGTVLKGIATPSLSGKNMWDWHFDDIFLYKGFMKYTEPLKEKIRLIHHIFAKEYKKDNILDPANYFIRAFNNFHMASLIEKTFPTILIYPEHFSENVMIYNENEELCEKLSYQLNRKNVTPQPKSFQPLPQDEPAPLEQWQDFADDLPPPFQDDEGQIDDWQFEEEHSDPFAKTYEQMHKEEHFPQY